MNDPVFLDLEMQDIKGLDLKLLDLPVWLCQLIEPTLSTSKADMFSIASWQVVQLGNSVFEDTVHMCECLFQLMHQASGVMVCIPGQHAWRIKSCWV